MEDETLVRRSKGFLVFTMEGNRGIPVLGLSITERLIQLLS